ncbi:MAG TPA: hypothetical protein VL125_07135 [Pelobium sp.]|nr:hypothetical protein [Pelobium sp.]
MRYKGNLLLLFLMGISQALTAQQPVKDVFLLQRKSWLQKAEASKPKLFETVKNPVSVVKIVKDTNAFQGWKVEGGRPLSSLYGSSFKKQSGVVVDFNEHLTGYFTITIKSVRGTPDGPLRFRFTFAEVPSELATPFDSFTGGLSRAWLQDEVVTVMDVPAKITLPRRFAFRYLKIDLLGSSPFYDFAITDMEVKATTSVNIEADRLTKNTSKMIADIDKVGLATLKECMQTVYEDGPKRDRRLWIGDLYLEALANTQSFKKHDLTKHCLYLLAGLSREDGFLHSSVFESPEPHPQAGVPFLFDYSLLYNVAVKDYFEATGDRTTALDLWPVVKKQLDGPLKYLKSDGMFDCQEAVKHDWWLFVDWSKALDREASIQGIIIYSLKQSYQLAKLLGKENEVSNLPALIAKMTLATRKNLYNKNTGLFESGPKKQISYASQAWMIISEVASKDESERALTTLLATKNAVKPGAPYLYHYVVEAMIKAGMTNVAKELVANYWGGMVKKGADTFWEVYDPSDDYLSPYDFFPINSYCHAWSCTPVYFIRKYPEVFQK